MHSNSVDVSVGVYSALFTSRMQTLLLLTFYAGLLTCQHVTQRLRVRADTVRDGTEL